MSFVNVDGSIASIFRTCQKALSQIYDVLERELQDADHASEFSRCGDAVGRLSMWDSETGAGLGRLDHQIRKSSGLRDGVEESLQELATITEEALLMAQVKNNEDMDNDKAYESSAAIEVDKSASSERGSNFSMSSTDLSSPLGQMIAEMHDILDCLFIQVPALQDPTPHNTRAKDEYEGAYTVDLSHLENKYPHANPELLNRLGVANWKRRQQLMSLRAQAAEEEIAIEPALNIGNSTTSEDNEIDTTSEADASQYSNINSVGIQSLATGEWTAFSGNGSTMPTAITSMSGDPMLKTQNLDRPVERVSSHRLRLPRPPKPNSMLEGKQFKCPYCSFELTEVATWATWKEHIMADLEPYLCTYGGCLRPAKNYGLSSDWTRHEIDVHQTQKGWLCRPCNIEFPSRKSFDSHMREKHFEHARKPRLDAFAEICEKTCDKLHGRTQCPLCAREYRDENKLRRHLADHLEQIALFAALPARPRLDNDDELDLMEDSESDGETRAESVMLDTQDSPKFQIEARNANVRKYLGDQADSKTRENHQAPQEANQGFQDCELSKNSAVSFPVSTVVHPPNESFYGRDQDLQKLRENLSSNGVICVVYGVGGIGKTLTAVEYAYRFKDEYDGVFWLQADTTPGLAESYGEIAHTLGLVEGNEDQAQILEQSRHWMDTTERRWLLIFDNVDDWEHVALYLPQDFSHSRGSIIVTTQISSLATKGSHNLHLQTFGEEDGSNMLLQYLNRPIVKSDPERAVAQEISGLVGGLPVCLSHIAGLAAYSELTLSELLEIFKQRRRHTGVATTEDDDLPASFRQAAYSYDEALAMVWHVTLRELSSDARDLVYILGYLNCEAIPESMLCDVHPEKILEFLDSREMIRYQRMKRSLVKRRLIQAKRVEGEACLSLHRSLQRSIRETAAKNTADMQRVFDQALILVRKAFPASSPVQLPDPASWRGHQRFMPHVMSLQSAFVEAKPTIRGSKKFAGLLSDAGVNQWARGFTRDGLLLLSTAEQVLDSVHIDKTSILRANIHSFIALMHDNTGISSRAESLERREVALGIRKEQLDSLAQVTQVEETLYYNAWLDYAISLLQYNRYQEVEPILDKCLKKYGEWGSADVIPYEYAKYGHKMGLIRMYQGRYEEALELCREGVQHMEKTGNDSLMLRFKFDLACIHLQKGNIQQSLDTHKKILKQRITVCGKVNENTLQSHYAIGALEEIRGNFAEAETSFQHALDQRRAAFWSVEAIARTQYHLAAVLRAQSKEPERAKRNYDEAKAILARYLPLDYPENLKHVKDDAILFDHMLTVYGARFTGRGLLDLVR